MVDKVLDQIDLLPKWSEGICNEISSPASAPINPRDEGLENLNQEALLDINILHFFQLTCPLKKTLNQKITYRDHIVGLKSNEL